MKNNFSLKDIIIKLILKNDKFKDRFTKYHPNGKYSLNNIIASILVILKSNISWSNKDLTCINNINLKTLYWHFSDFVKNTIFKDCYIYLLKKYFKLSPIKKLKYQFVDSTFIPNKHCKNNIGRNKFYKGKKGCKISCITDSLGIPISVLIGKGSTYDTKFIDQHLNDFLIKIPIKKKYILADKAYDSKKVRRLFDKNNYNCIIDYNKRKTKDPAKIKYLSKNEKLIYKKRIRIENLFSWLKQNNRINKINETNLNTFTQFVYLAFCKIIFNRL